MTIAALLAKVDRLKPNQVDAGDKLSWLSNLDLLIFTTLFQTHATDDTTPETFAGYDDSTDQDTTELLVAAPYDDLYVYHLFMQIDLRNMEWQKFNNSTLSFNAAYDKYAAYYNRTHLPNDPVAYYTI